MAVPKGRIARLRNPIAHRVIGVDPGLQATGVALLEGDHAVFWTLRSPKGLRNLAEKVLWVRENIPWCNQKESDTLVIEHMQVYPQRKMEGDPNDLINLAVVEGAVLASITAKSYCMPTPAQWNGGVPKKVRHQRLRDNVIEKPDGRVSEHAMDALGLAVYGLERLLWLRQRKTPKP